MRNASGKHTAINATTGRVMVTGCTDSEFDRWYDQCASDFRQVRDIEQVNPDLRAAYAKADAKTHYLVEV